MSFPKTAEVPKHCYEKYTLFLRHSVQSTGEESEKQIYKYEKSLDVFCKDFVIERLIKEDNIYYMRKLKKEFTRRCDVLKIRMPLVKDLFD